MGVTVVVVSHDVKMLMNLSDWVTVINFGEKIAEDCPGIFRRTPAFWRPTLVPNDSKVPLLAVEDISVSYGQVKAVKQASLAVFPGRLWSSSAPTGPAKPPCWRHFGDQHPKFGAIRFMGKDITGNPADRNVRAGLCLAPEAGVFSPP